MDGTDQDPTICICGGSGWTPGCPDDEPCPFHADESEYAKWEKERRTYHVVSGTPEQVKRGWAALAKEN